MAANKSVVRGPQRLAMSSSSSTTLPFLTASKASKPGRPASSAALTLQHFVSAKKIKLGFALLSDRPVLLLDEPTTNFDDHAKNWFFNRLEQQRHKLIIVASNETREIDFCEEKIAIQDFK